MGIQYRLTEKSDNINQDPKKGYYPQVVTRGTVDTSELCRCISSQCALRAADVKAALEALAEFMEQKLSEGYNISIDELGTFSVSAGACQAEASDTITDRQVAVKKINYRPSVRLKKALREAQFEQINQAK